MPKKKGLRMTRQVRAYEETVEFIGLLLRRKPAGTTFADVLEETMRKAYPELYDRAIQAKKQAESILDEALGTTEK